MSFIILSVVVVSLCIFLQEFIVIFAVNRRMSPHGTRMNAVLLVVCALQTVMSAQLTMADVSMNVRTQSVVIGVPVTAATRCTTMDTTARKVTCMSLSLKIITPSLISRDLYTNVQYAYYYILFVTSPIHALFTVSLQV